MLNMRQSTLAYITLLLAFVGTLSFVISPVTTAPVTINHDNTKFTITNLKRSLMKHQQRINYGERLLRRQVTVSRPGNAQLDYKLPDRYIVQFSNDSTTLNLLRRDQVTNDSSAADCNTTTPIIDVIVQNFQNELENCELNSTVTVSDGYNPYSTFFYGVVIDLQTDQKNETEVWMVLQALANLPQVKDIIPVVTIDRSQPIVQGVEASELANATINTLAKGNINTNKDRRDMPTKLQRRDDAANILTGASSSFIQNRNLRGKGVQVCVIDTGIDYTHPGRPQNASII
jgi:hypothetical protein